MANDCYTNICLRGTLPAIKEFERMCKYEYDMWNPRKCQERHFMRIRDYIGMYDIQPLGMGLYYAHIELDCAWSAFCCLFSGSGSYYNQWMEEYSKMVTSRQPYINIQSYAYGNHEFVYKCKYGPWQHETNIDNSSMYFVIPGGPIMCTTLPYECYRLGLDAEVWTEEPGMGFQEHYRIYHGIVVLDECLDMYCEEIKEDTTLESIQAKYPNMEIDSEYFDMCKEDLDNGYEAYIDIKHYLDYTIEGRPHNMCGHIMCDKI